MLEGLKIVSEQVGILFVLIAIGFICQRKRILSDESVKGMVDLLVLVVTPCLIAHAFIRPFNREMLGVLGWSFVAAFISPFAGMVLSFLFRNKDDSRKSVLRFGMIFSNAGFMGIPLQYAILGRDGVFYGSIYVTVFNVLCWSYGLYVMCGSMKDLRWRQLLINPGTVGLAIGLFFFLFSIEPPDVIKTPMKLMSDLNTPLAMTAIGFYLGKARLGVIVRYAPAYWVAVFRLVVLPVAVGYIYFLMRVGDGIMEVAMLTATAAPCAALNSMLAAKYKRDVEISAGLVAGTTLLSIITMPVIIALAMKIFNP